MRAWQQKPQRSTAPTVEDLLQREQTEAVVDAMATILRSLVQANPDVKVRAITRNGLTTLAVAAVSAYVLKRAEQEARPRDDRPTDILA